MFKYEVRAFFWNGLGPLGSLRRVLEAPDPDAACALARPQLDDVAAGAGDPTLRYEIRQARRVR